MRSISILVSLVLLGIAGFAINHAYADTCAGVTCPTSEKCFNGLCYHMDCITCPSGMCNMKWYSYGGHLEKSVIETKLLEVRYDNKEEELFEAI